MKGPLLTKENYGGCNQVSDCDRHDVAACCDTQVDLIRIWGRELRPLSPLISFLKPSKETKAKQSLRRAR